MHAWIHAVQERGIEPASTRRKFTLSGGRLESVRARHVLLPQSGYLKICGENRHSGTQSQPDEMQPLIRASAHVTFPIFISGCMFVFIFRCIHMHTCILCVLAQFWLAKALGSVAAEICGRNSRLCCDTKGLCLCIVLHTSCLFCTRHTRAWRCRHVLTYKCRMQICPQDSYLDKLFVCAHMYTCVYIIVCMRLYQALLFTWRGTQGGSIYEWHITKGCGPCPFSQGSVSSLTVHVCLLEHMDVCLTTSFKMILLGLCWLSILREANKPIIAFFSV